MRSSSSLVRTLAFHAIYIYIPKSARNPGLYLAKGLSGNSNPGDRIPYNNKNLYARFYNTPCTLEISELKLLTWSNFINIRVQVQNNVHHFILQVNEYFTNFSRKWFDRINQTLKLHEMACFLTFTICSELS
jgi:hypothetical protein